MKLSVLKKITEGPSGRKTMIIYSIWWTSVKFSEPVVHIIWFIHVYAVDLFTFWSQSVGFQKITYMIMGEASDILQNSSRLQANLVIMTSVYATPNYDIIYPVVDCVWNVMAHGDAWEEKWRGNKRMEWVTSKRHMTAEHRFARAVQTLQVDVHSLPVPVVDWTDPPADLNGLIRFAERWNLVSARVPSHFKHGLPINSSLLVITLY